MKKEEEKEEEKGTTEPTGKTPAAGQGRKKKKGRGRKIAIGIFAALLGVTAVADTLVFTRFSVPLDKAFPGKVNNEDEIKESQDNALAVAKSLEEEGAVLLENDGALPLQGTKINLLGYGAYTPVYGGTGSGGSSYLANRTDFVTAFRNAGFEVNDAAAAVYQTDADAQANTFTVDFSIPEVPATKELADEEGVEFKYTGDASFESMKAFSDTAVIVFSRKGGEDNDLPRDMSEYGVTDSDKSKHYLELSDEEQSLLDEATATFNKVIVLINSGNAMELGFLKNEDSNGQQIAGDPDAAGDVDAALWVGDPGDVGTVAVAEILKGEVNPSGRLTDIYPYAVETTPSYYNFGEYAYTNSAPEFSNFDNHLAYLVDYQEGIYIGYRYYETRDSFDYTSREGETFQDLSYEDVVEYPFGYGLSYTDFDWTITGLTNGGSFDKDTAFSVTVEVTNTGDVAGKEVVQLYYTAPYDAEGRCGSGRLSDAFDEIMMKRTVNNRQR